MIFSCIIPVRDMEDPKLKDLIRSIKNQDFPQDEIEILTITEGDSEQAKATGIRKSTGSICAMFCSDNFLTDPTLFKQVYSAFHMDKSVTGVYTKYYQTVPSLDNSLNLYFSLIGSNDPIPFYLGKADRSSWYDYDRNEISSYLKFPDRIPSFGDNGFFYRRDIILKSNLDHYYPMDCAEDLRELGYYVYKRINSGGIWHRTADKLIPFLIKRYRYARDLYCDRNDRRWKMLSTRKDYWRLFLFILAVLTIIQPLYISIKGFSKVRDWSWFWHWPVAFSFLIMYGILTVRTCLKRLLSYRPLDVVPV